MKKWGVMWLFAMATSCAGPSEAEIRTYDAVAPEYRNYVERDAGLTVEQRGRRLRTIETWGMRVRPAVVAK